MPSVPVDPPVVPVGFWTTPPLEEAFAARHMGRVVRAYRTHPWHGRRPLSQELVASWLGTTQPRLSRAENGPRLEHLDVLVHWTVILGVPQRHLWFALPNRSTAPNGQALATVERIRQLVVGNFTEGADLAGRSGGTGNAVPVSVVLRRRIVDAWSAYQAGRYTRALALVPENLEISRAATTAIEGRQQLGAHRLAALAHHNAAAVLTKIGEPDLAWMTAERGLVSARESESTEVTSSLLRSVAHCLMSAGRLTAANAVVADGLNVTDPRRGQSSTTRLSVHGTLLLTGGVLAARRGDYVEAAELNGRAERAAQQLGRDGNHLWTAFGPSNVTVHQVSLLVEQGAHRQALDLAEQVDLSSLPIERRLRAQLDTARALSAVHRVSDALAVVLQAESASPELVRRHFIARDLVALWLRQQRAGTPTELRELSRRLRIG